jgi:hypothetical protein
MSAGGWRTGREWGDLDVALVLVLARYGYTYGEAAKLLKRSRNSVAGVARRCGIAFPRLKPGRHYPYANRKDPRRGRPTPTR